MENNTEEIVIKRHELKSLINGSIKDITKFDKLLDEIQLLSAKKQFEVNREHFKKFLKDEFSI